MQTSLYTVTVPTLQNSLTALKGVLSKAEAYAKEQGMNPDDYLAKQLAPDMFPLVKQVQVACDNAKGFPFRVMGTEPPSIADTETTMAQLQARIDATLAILKDVKPEDLDKNEDTEVHISYFPGKHLTGFGYAMSYVIPNFFFHLTTAYDILRNQGVPLGKGDYIGMLPLRDNA